MYDDVLWRPACLWLRWSSNESDMHSTNTRVAKRQGMNVLEPVNLTTSMQYSVLEYSYVISHDLDYKINPE